LKEENTTPSVVAEASPAVVVLCVMNTKTDSSVGITFSRV
jgi:hypothetical protein